MAKPSQLKRMMRVCIDARRPFFMYGQPGVGKSDIVRQVFEELGFDTLIDERFATKDNVDVHGLPKIEGNRTVWTMPDFWPDPAIHGETGILFLDELTSAPRPIQATLYQIVLDRKLGREKLPDGWHVVAAGNRVEDRAIVHEMSTALRGRFIHADFDVDNDEWHAWAVAHDIAPEVISFVKWQPNLLAAFDPTQRSCPMPRTWEFVSDLIKAGYDRRDEMELIYGTIGQGAGSSFIGFLQIWRELPPLDLILMDPDRVDVPDEPSALWAIAVALGRKAHEDNWPNIMSYLNRVPGDVATIAVNDACQRAPELANTMESIQWFATNSPMHVRSF
jgi:hypothetical protein